MYEAYGNIVLSTGSSQNNRLANTKERDFSIGLDNHGFRYFDPEVGRYISPDPIGYGDGLNWWIYVNNNPINRIDPLGLGWFSGAVSWITTGEYREDADAGALLKAAARGAGEGAKTGGKALVNAAASTVVSTVTLGVKDRVEVISVSNEERALYEQSYALQKGGLDVVSGVVTGGLGNAGKVGKVVNALDKANDLADKARTAVEVVDAAVQGDLTKVATTVGSNLAQQQLAKKLNSADTSTAKAPEGAGDGVIYLRSNKKTGGEYVGQAKSRDRYDQRQQEHRDAHPDADYEFTELQTAKPGKDLDVAEESWIRAGGGPKTDPGGRLENDRHQMSDDRYKAAGGTIEK